MISEFESAETAIFNTKLVAETNIIALFEQQVELTPDAIALICNDETYTYKSLNSLSNSLAHLLIQKYKIQKGDVTGILLDKTEYCYIAILAILKCGGIYMPLSDALPEERITYMLQHASAKLLISSSKFKPEAYTTDYLLTDSAEFHRHLRHEAATNPAVAISPGDGAYIMYTSGTTAYPNAVLIPHRAVVRLVSGSHYFPFNEKHRFLQISNLSFDASTFEIWGALLNGNSLISSTQLLTDLQTLSYIISEYKISAVFLTTSFFNLIVNENITLFQSLKYLLVGGEALSVKHVEKLKAKYPEIVFINGYGPTECTTFACCYQIPDNFNFECKSIPIGKAITQTKTYIFDEQLNECDIDVKGELYLGGDGLALGYLNNDALNKERFIYHPTNATERLYKTGDICSVNETGTIIYHGRTDNQLKIRGFRIEIEEVENSINGHALIKNCVIIPYKTSFSTAMIAFIVAKHKQSEDDIVQLNTIDVTVLKNDLQKWMPEYMIPAIFIELNRIPLTKNAKADRKKLQGIFEARKYNLNAPEFSDKTEEIIYSIWKKHLVNTEIDLNANFFDIGGESLQAVSVMNDINTHLHINIPVAEIYKSPTIQLLAAYIQSLNSTETSDNLITQLKPGTGTALFLAPGLGGDALTFIHFVKNFSANNPVYCFNYPLADNINDKLTMEKMAYDYRNEITKINHENPVQLLGFSFGGRLVFEIALQLQTKGICIEKLIITDIVAPSFKINYIKAIDILSFELYLFKHIPLKAKYKFLRKRIGGLIRLYLKKESENSKNTNIQINTNDSVYHKIYYNYHTFEKYNGDMILFRSKQESASPYRKLYYLNLINSYLFWNNNINGKIHKFELECDHTQFFNKENVKNIIRLMVSSL